MDIVSGSVMKPLKSITVIETCESVRHEKAYSW
jgi:hypothetical protein